MSITRNFNLFLNAGRSIPLVINANQYDQGEQWIFTLYNSDGTQYTPATGAIVGIKSDGNLIANAGTVNGSGQVVITETEQMTAAAGKAVYELQIDSDTHGTANFIVMVEESPTEGGTASDSDLSLMQEAIDSVGELEDLLNGETVDEKILPIVQSETSDWLAENITNPSSPPIDTSLTVSSAAADAKVTGDEITDLKSAIAHISDDTNLFNKLTIENGRLANTTGAIITSGADDYFTSDYISVTAGCLYVKNSPTEDAYHRICVYRWDKSFIQGSAINNNQITIPSSGAFIRFCGKDTEVDTTQFILVSAKDKVARDNIVLLEDAVSYGGTPVERTQNATSGTVFDARTSVYGNTSLYRGKILKFRYECDSDIFPTGLYVVTGDGKYLNGAVKYLPNTDYYVDVSDQFADSNQSAFGLYGASESVSDSGSVVIKFWTLDYYKTREYIQLQINRINDEIPQYNVDLIAWGDSLTAGAGGEGTTYPSVCASELGLTVRNCGVGGETANTISARQGGNNVVIPAGAINGTYSTLTDIFGTSIDPLLQGNGAGSASYVYINGEKCTITYSNSVYTISGYTGGASAIPLLGMFEGSNFSGKIVTIWVGANGSRVGSDTSVAARMAIIDSMIKHIGHDRYVVFTNWKANGVESDFTADDAEMLMHYGNKLFPVRKMLVDYGLTLMGITPTAQDTTDIANGTVPSSLRSDSVHLNANGYTAVGKFLADKIRSLGYVD